MAANSFSALSDPSRLAPAQIHPPLIKARLVLHTGSASLAPFFKYQLQNLPAYINPAMSVYLYQPYLHLYNWEELTSQKKRTSSYISKYRHKYFQDKDDDFQSSGSFFTLNLVKYIFSITAIALSPAYPYRSSYPASY